jgi:glutamyl-tRNA reductase
LLSSLGVNHRTASLPILDAATLQDVPRFYGLLKSMEGLRGSVILQTCNRVEFYLDTFDVAGIEEKVLWHWALDTRFKLGELSRLVVKNQEGHVIRHLVRLAAGLDSMLLGEGQVLDQVKDAIAIATAQGASGSLLPGVFETAIAAARSIRERTRIEEETISLGQAAVRVAEKALGQLEERRVLLIGTGQVGTLVMKALKSYPVGDVTVSGRTLDTATALAKTFGAKPLDVREIPDRVASYDLVVLATKAPEYLITKEMIQRGFSRTGGRLVILDLSTHPNVSPGVSKLEGVIIKTLEDLRGITDETLNTKTELVNKAELLVEEESQKILKILSEGDSSPRSGESMMLEILPQAFRGV